jgi:(2Fe-2S) ferredoxin
VESPLSQPIPEADLADKAPVCAAPLRHHVFVCTGLSCSNHQSQETLQAFYDVLHQHGLLYGKRGTPQGTVMVTTCGSVGLCAIGPAVLIYPEGIWYSGVTATDVPALVQSHFCQSIPYRPHLVKQFPIPTQPSS